MRNNKYQWKKICACLLAVCLSATLLMSHYIPGAFAEEVTGEQAADQSTQASSTESMTEEKEETTEEKSKSTTEERKETTEESKEQKTTTQTTTQAKKKTTVKIQQAAWEYKSGDVTVSGNGTDPKKITSQTGSNEGKYTGSKSVVFDYKIDSTGSIDKEVTIDISDCGIMSDDDSIEIWKIENDTCKKIDSELQISEGKVSFTADSLGEYIAVSDVTTVDLAKSNVVVYQDRFTGERQDGKSIEQHFSDDSNKKYRISQSNNNNRTSYGITYEGKFDNTRKIILDGINTSNIISIAAQKETKLVTLQLRRENQIKRIFYGTGHHENNSETENNNDDSRLKIENYDQNDENSGQLYIPYKMSSKEEENKYILEDKDTATGNVGADWSLAGIGGQDSGKLNNATGITIAGGMIRVIVKNINGATAIGGGGNGDGQVSITGGDITAICSSTGAAIGGGIGWVNRGGNADVSITGGTVYAENMDFYSRNNIEYGGVAIGSGSSTNSYGSKANITIGGNSKVTAYARYGNAIGSGNSYQKSAADAKITISGNSIVKTNALGGGTSKSNQGGSADITVSDDAKVDCVKYSEIDDEEKHDTVTENILGAFGIGGGNSADTYKGGSANVNVTGGTMNCNGGNIGGGNATGSGDGGDASINVTGGTLDCASIGGGNSINGAPGAVTSETNAGVVVSGGTLRAGTIGGGTNEKNEIGFATADISGGDIQGQFILANTDTSKRCTFKMSGGTIDNTHLGEGTYKKAQANGGAVYLSDSNGLVEMSGGTIQNSKAPLGGAVYMTAGEFKLSGNGKIQDCTATTDNSGKGYGGAVYLEEGTVTINGGFIGTEKTHANKAVKGAGVYQKAGTMNVTGGNISYNEADEDGAGVYLAGGTLNISGGTLESNHAKNGAGAYVSNGALNISGGKLISNEATNGGGFYLAGGKLKILDGTITLNEATNGAGMYVSDSTVRMFGGEITLNKAISDGGGMYVSSDKKAADVVVRSGKISNNRAIEGNGGAVAVVSQNEPVQDHVIIGLCETHPELNSTDRTFQAFTYKDDQDEQTEHNHASCPQMTDNQAKGNGGGIYMSSSKATLDIYCLYEDKNTSEANSSGGSVMTEGGNVNIGDKDNNNANARGNTCIKSPMLVKGGKVEISGNMENPYFDNNILVDIREGAGSFIDHRIDTSPDDKEKEYKIHYYENFQGSGMYIVKQYPESVEITAEGTMYTHEGYKIVEWNTEADKSGQSYKIGSNIASKGDHEAWDKYQDDTGALVLFAIWEKTTYTVHYNPNADSYSGSMKDDTFEYDEPKKLSENQYKVKGKRFAGWNTQQDGNGTAYPNDYNESKMTLTDGETITLYAQWVDCTHKDGEHPGKLSYTVDNGNHQITENCDCEGYTASVRITAADAYYDQKQHPASLIYEGILLAGNPTIKYSKKSINSEDYTDMENGAVPTEVGFYQASITVGGKTVSVKYEIKSPAADTTIDVKLTKGQRFEEFSGQTNCEIAKDDAFTIQFDVQKLNQHTTQETRFKAPTLSFDQALPQNTKIIMQTGDEYWYYKVENSDVNNINVTSFIKMGVNDTAFTYNAEDSEQQYRFIIDFSNVEKTSQLSDSLKITMTYENDDSQIANVFKAGTISIANASEFTIKATDNKLNITSAPLNDMYTRWENKIMLWKISSNESDTKLPSDAKLTVTTDAAGTQQTDNYQQNQKGEFIVPFIWNQNKGFEISLNSELEKYKGTSYTLKAELYVGNLTDQVSLPNAAEDNELKVSTTMNTMIPKDSSPALRIMEGKRILTRGTDMTLDLSVNYKNIESYEIKATIERKTGSEYSGNFLDTEVVKGENKFSLGGIQESGNYRLLIKVTTKDNQTIMTVPYYFIVK